MKVQWGKRTVHVSDGWYHTWSMGVVSHGRHGLGRVGMEVVGREQKLLTTQLVIPEHFLCARWEHCWHLMERMPCQVFV